MSEVNLSAAIKAATQVKSAIAKLSEQSGVLQAEREALKVRIEDLQSLPLLRAEQKQFLFDFIDSEAANFVSRAAKSFEGIDPPKGRNRPKPMQGAAPKHLCLRDMDCVLSGGFQEAENVLGHVNFFQHVDDGVHMWAPPRIYYFFGDIIKKKIEDNFDELMPQLPRAALLEPLLSVVEKRAEIESILQRCSEIDTELTTIKSSLRNLTTGVS